MPGGHVDENTSSDSHRDHTFCLQPAGRAGDRGTRAAAQVEYRAGPGEAYDVAGVLEPGQRVAAVNRSADGAYVLIEDPASSTVLGWLLADAIRVEKGDPTSVRLLPTALPTPVK
jgi:hypothetical protein